MLWTVPCGWSCEKGSTTGRLGLKSSQVTAKSRLGNWGRWCCSRELTKLAPALTQDIVHTPRPALPSQQPDPVFLILSLSCCFLAEATSPASAVACLWAPLTGTCFSLYQVSSLQPHMAKACSSGCYDWKVVEPLKVGPCWRPLVTYVFSQGDWYSDPFPFLSLCFLVMRLCFATCPLKHRHLAPTRNLKATGLRDRGLESLKLSLFVF